MKLQANVNRLSPYLFLAPAALVLVFALLYPIGYTVVASFFDWRMGVPFAQASWAGWGNYIWLFNDPDFFESLGVTISFAFSVVGLMWRYMYNPQFGVFNQLLTALNLPTIPWLSDPDWALPSIIIADIWQWTPFIFILALAALQSLPRSALEAARIDGASAWQQIIYVKIPLMMPVLVVAALLRLIDAFKVLEVIFIMTNGGPGLSTEILSLRIYKTAFVAWDLGRAAALSNLLLGLVMLITVAMIIVNKALTRRPQAA